MPQTHRVTDPAGHTARIEPSPSHPKQWRLRLPNGGIIDPLPEQTLEQTAEGYRLRLPLAQLQQQAERPGEGESATLPVVEERLNIEKREVERGKVRIRKQVEQHEEQVEVPLEHTRAEVERVEVNRYVDEMPAERREGDTLIVPVVEEVLVVQKRLLLKEELHIRQAKVREEHRETVTLRRERVEVEREHGN